MKASGTSYIFGGFTSIKWNREEGYNSDPNAFLFSLTNKDNQSFKMRQIETEDFYSIHCDPANGPIFGGNDLHIGDSANTTAGCYSKLGCSYEHPQPDQGDSYLAGSDEFQLSEIEVFKKE